MTINSRKKKPEVSSNPGTYRSSVGVVGDFGLVGCAATGDGDLGAPAAAIFGPSAGLPGPFFFSRLDVLLCDCGSEHRI